MATPLDHTATVVRAGAVRRSTYEEHPAPAWSRDLVACTWRGIAGWSRRLRVLPDGCVDIAWDGSGVVLTPPAETARRVAVRTGTVTVGVRLRPAAARAVLGPVLAELDAPVALRDVWVGNDVSRLEHALLASSADAAADGLVAAIVAHARRAGPSPDPRLHAAIEHMRRPRTSVEQAAGAVGWSMRQLRRRCLDEVGLAPKTLQQVLRFQRALAALGTEPLARTAVAHGYADQAHLTRAVRRHAGATPGALLRRRAGGGGDVSTGG